MAETKKEKKKLGLSTKILISLLAGAITGVLIHYVMPDSSFKSDILINGILYVLGNGFIRLMQMLVVPLVFCSLVCGSMAIGDTKTLGKVGIKTIIFYLCTTALAVCVALGVAFLISPGMGMNQVASETQEAATQTVNFAETEKYIYLACRGRYAAGHHFCIIRWNYAGETWKQGIHRI